jgi:hypothetical protein
MSLKLIIIRDLYSGINEFKSGYYPLINIIKDEICNLLADSRIS